MCQPGPTTGSDNPCQIARGVYQAIWLLITHLSLPSFPILPLPTSWIRQDSGGVLCLLAHTWYHPQTARRFCGSQLQLANQSPYLILYTDYMLHTTVTFLKGLQPRKFWQPTGLYKLSLGLASASNLLLQFFAMKSLRSQGQAIHSLQHKSLPDSLLHIGHEPTKTVTEFIKHNSQPPLLRNPIPKSMTGFLLHQ